MKIEGLRLTHPDTLQAMKNAWRNTLRKCRHPGHHNYGYYGARGITVCARWNSFENFVEDMGLRPEGMTLERKNNNGNYEPGNCVWASRQTQTENRRTTAYVEWQGRKMTVSAWEREFGWKAGVLKARLNRLGYSVEEAFTKPVEFGVKVPGRLYKVRAKPDMSRVPRGFDSVHSKLTPADLPVLRKRHAEGESFSALAREYSLSVTTVSNAVQRLKSYKGT